MSSAEWQTSVNEVRSEGKEDSGCLDPPTHTLFTPLKETLVFRFWVSACVIKSYEEQTILKPSPKALIVLYSQYRGEPHPVQFETFFFFSEFQNTNAHKAPTGTNMSILIQTRGNISKK